MHTHDLWASEPELIGHLGGHLRRGNLSLFLGAGISKPFKLPTWDELVNRLFEDAGAQRPTTTTREQQVESLRKAQGWSTAELRRRVSNALYAGCDASFSALMDNRTLSAIGALVMASSRGSVSEVVTLNYDDLLERYLRFNGVVVSSRESAAEWQGRADVVVQHPHGLLRYPPENESGDQMPVLDQASYQKKIGNPADPWNQTISATLRTTFPLFIGLSGEDVALDNLLHNVLPESAASGERLPYVGVSFIVRGKYRGKMESDVDFAARQSSWTNRQIFPQVLSDWSVALPNFLLAICQAAAEGVP